MLLEEDFKQWCADEGLSAPVWIDTDPPEGLNRCFRMSITGGLGLTTEYVLDRPTFEMRTRGVSLSGLPRPRT